MQRLTNETMSNFPSMAGETASESKVFDARGNRINSCRDGYCVQDTQFDFNAPDRLSNICWWRSFLSPGVCFVGYGHDFSVDGTLYGIYGLKNVGTARSISFDYPFTSGLSDVYATATRGVTSPGVIQEAFYDAFGRRRHKRNAVGDAQEFIYDLGHQLLVDVNWKDTVVGTTSDEYVWLDGRPVLAFRSNLSTAGAHSEDFVGSADTMGQCSRPLDDQTVNCGLFHLVSNLQRFVNVAMWDWTGQVASLQLPDADGTVNEQRMYPFGDHRRLSA